MEKKRIMVITKKLTGGGAERVATNLAGCLAACADVELVVFNGEENTYGTTVPTVDLKMPAKKGLLGKVTWHLNAMQRLRAEKRRFCPTHSISFLVEPDLANVLSRGKEKVIVSVRNKQSELDRNWILRTKDAFLYRSADAVVALSRMVKEDLTRVYKTDPKKITTIYNPCYTESISARIREDVLTPEEKRFFEENSGKIVITAGRLHFQKGQWHLIRCFPEILKEVKDAKLVILGQGDEEEYLRGLAAEMGLENNVFFWGFKKNPYAYLAKADVFAFPSVFEGLGNILLECMACGLPIVSADCPYGPKELLNPGADLESFVKETTFGEFGILVPPMEAGRMDAAQPLTDSEIALAEALIRMLTEPELRAEYRERVIRRSGDFAPDIITGQWLRVLDALN